MWMTFTCTITWYLSSSKEGHSNPFLGQRYEVAFFSLIILRVIFLLQRFALMIGFFTLLSNAMMVIGSVLLDKVLDMPGSYHSCAVGFSAVIFALKVVTTQLSSAPLSQYALIPLTRSLTLFIVV